MASSTTSPMESTIANKVKTLIVNPDKYIIKKDPIKETGITRIGIIVVRQSRKKANMIITTRKNAR